MSDSARPTPARQQYLDVKRQHPDAIVWFRMGDFYEMFDEDARVAARDLSITLTTKYFGDERVPLAGVPYHAAHSYLARLVRRGHKVAICEQLSEAGHGLVERGVVRVVTAGTIAELNLLRERENNYLAAVAVGNGAYGLAYVDVTTGEFAATQLAGHEAAAALVAEMHRVRPAEWLAPDGFSAPEPLPGHLVSRPPARFDPDAAREELTRQFGVLNLEAFGCEHLPLAVTAAGAVVAYVGETNAALLPLLHGLRTYSTQQFMTLDPATRRNLELVHAGRSGGARGSLISVLDTTATPMGGRLLRSYLGQPLLDLAAIRQRHDAVAALVADRALRTTVRELLAAIGSTDLERITGRIAQGSATPRELLALREALLLIARLRQALERDGSGALSDLAGRLDSCPEVASVIERAVAETPPRLMREGYRRELDEIAATAGQARRTLAELERTERERTGIKSLKVGYNKVSGYYVEVTRPNRALVPDDYICRQTLVDADRFITPGLKELETKIVAAECRIAELERELFAELLRHLAEAAPRLLATARALAQLDVFASFAETAVCRDYVRPSLDEGIGLEITGGRHPVVEVTHGEQRFVPNDCTLDADGRQIVLLTGPNMAGKSTYLRQVALIVLLAQIGSFVPAAAARIGLVDRIFTRIGAQDDIAAGASTFMVEMAETAAILRHATRRSLVVLDEVGRGTSARDGVAIARAVAEYLHDHVGARTLFATHYDELTTLERALPRLHNAHTVVVEEGGNVVFLYRIAPGGTDRSYGVHVARLAGLPPLVTRRAEELLRAVPATPGPFPHQGGKGRSSPSPLVGEGAGGEGFSPCGRGSAAAPPTPDPFPHQGGRDGGSHPSPLVGPGSATAQGERGELGGESDVQHLADRAVSYAPGSPPDVAGDDAIDAVVRQLLAIDVAGTTPLAALNLLHALQERARGDRASFARPPSPGDGSGTMR